MLRKGEIWTGYRSVNIPVERKYSVVSSKYHGQYRPTIQFTDYQNDIVYSEVYTTEPFEQLVSDINEVAFIHSGAAGGVFYVNEFKQVIKPVGGISDSANIYVGEYPDLHFIFDCKGRLIDNDDVSGLEVGDPWPHQKVGTRYHYSAHRGIVYYEHEDGNTIRRCQFTISPGIIDALWEVKNRHGGQFYVNEHGHVFAPQIEEGPGTDFYVGTIDYSQWLPKWA